MGIQNSLPLVGNKTVGLRTEYATLLPPGSKVAAYVGSIQSDSLDAYSASTLLVQTLNAGLARCRPGKGDVVVVLPGHTENVSTADFMNNLVAGTQILGVAPFGSGLMPTLTFTATAATFLLDQPNCVLSGIKFAVGIDAVVNYLVVTGAGNYIGGCYFQCGTAAALDMNTAIVVNTGATDLIVEGNQFITTTTGVNVTQLLIAGTGVDNFQVRGNYFFGNCPTNGNIRVTGTATGFSINNNAIHNTTATTPIVIGFANTALVGSVYNNLGFSTSGVTTVQGFGGNLNTTGDIRFANNVGCSADATGSIQSPLGSPVF